MDRTEENPGTVTKRLRRLLVLVPLLILAAAGGVVCLGHLEGREVTEDAYVHATIYPVSPRVPGKVLEVAVDSYDRVQAGQLLVRLDPESYEVAVRTAEASVSAARMHHEEARIGVRAAEAEHTLVQAKLAQAKTDLDRYETLWKRNTLPKEQYDRAVTQHRVLSAQRRVAEARRTLAEARVESSGAALESAEAQLASARLNLAYTEIRSPASGVIAQKGVEEGAVVQPGAPLMAVVDLEDVWVEANFKETQLERVRPGLKARVEIDAYPGLEIPGHVEALEPGTGAAFSLFPPENATGNWVKTVQRIPVKIVLDRHGGGGESMGPLRVGMSAHVRVDLEAGSLLDRCLSILPGR